MEGERRRFSEMRLLVAPKAARIARARKHVLKMIMVDILHMRRLGKNNGNVTNAISLFEIINYLEIIKLSRIRIDK